jgi:putative acetyltransferase
LLSLSKHEHPHPAASTIRHHRGMTDVRYLIELDSIESADVQALIAEHLADMFATSPAESVHALPLAELGAPDMTFWTARDSDGRLLGCVALKHLGEREGELKSMRTATASRGAGVGAALLAQVVSEASRRGYRRLLLETGTQDFFAPARRLYERAGFETTGPFASYVLDPNSVFMEFRL